MAREINYDVMLFPCERSNGFYSTKFNMSDMIDGKLPNRKIVASSLDNLLQEVEAFAKEHGKPCEASVRLPRGLRKPSGFDRRTSRLYYNMPANA